MYKRIKINENLVVKANSQEVLREFAPLQWLKYHLTTGKDTKQKNNEVIKLVSEAFGENPFFKKYHVQDLTRLAQKDELLNIMEEYVTNVNKEENFYKLVGKTIVEYPLNLIWKYKVYCGNNDLHGIVYEVLNKYITKESKNFVNPIYQQTHDVLDNKIEDLESRPYQDEDTSDVEGEFGRNVNQYVDESFDLVDKVLVEDFMSLTNRKKSKFSKNILSYTPNLEKNLKQAIQNDLIELDLEYLNLKYVQARQSIAKVYANNLIYYYFSGIMSKSLFGIEEEYKKVMYNENGVFVKQLTNIITTYFNSLLEKEKETGKKPVTTLDRVGNILRNVK